MKLLPILLLAFVLSLGVACASEPSPRPTPDPTTTVAPTPVPVPTPDPPRSVDQPVVATTPPPSPTDPPVPVPTPTPTLLPTATPTPTAHDTVQLDFITQWGSQLTGDGQLNGSRGVAVDGTGQVYVAETRNHRVQVFSLTPTETVTPRPTPTPFEPGTGGGQQAGDTQGEQIAPVGFNLTVSIGGEGTGGVQVGAGLSSSFECQEAQCFYESVQAMFVTVVAIPDYGSVFQGWSVADQPGACPGTGSCQITMDRDVTVIATFTQP